MEKINAFLSAVSSDTQFEKELSRAKNKQEYVKVAHNYGFDLTELDLEKIKNIANAYEKQQAGTPLSEAELELVSGGIFSNTSPRLPGLW